jgi:pyruvate dehydrogenase E2 component (dihydrolipoamide acetyltransferase)
MITAVEIPKLTLTMEGGTLVRWLKREGDPVQKDDVLFELETDKANVEVASPANGCLKKILVKEGAVVVGSTVAFIGEEEDVLPDPTTRETAQPRSFSPTLGSSAPERPSSGSPIIRATPAARRRAQEAGLSVTSVTGTGPEGRITQEDVENAIARRAEGPTHVVGVTSDFRSLIAERTARSWHTVPHIHIGGELNAAGLKTALEKARRSETPTIGMTDLLLFTVAEALRACPTLNAVWRDGRADPRPELNLGFAVHSVRGVIAPVIHDVERRSLAEISVERIRLREAVVHRSLQPRDLEEGTFTLTNLGMYPVDFFAPIVNHPQCAILATGRVRQVAAAGTGVVPAWRMWANVALDHRVLDGAAGAHFLAELERLIENLPSRV